ncbi:MAG: hypothetical protein ACI4NE_01285 [Succinivibrio sp.]
MKIKKRNFVQEYSLQFNKAQIFTDRKKAMKKGYRKHKGSYELSSRQDVCYYFLWAA